MKTRYIFDLDGTLLTGNFTETDQFLMETFGEEAGRKFIHDMKGVLDRYEKKFPRYDYELLSGFLSERTGLAFTPEIVREWDYLVSEITDTEEEHAREVLEYLKSQDKSVVVLTNWFGESQTGRLKRSGLLECIDTVYGGDIITKPHRQAYWMAAAGRRPSECLFIGDNVDNDYIGPKACGMDSVLYDKNNHHHKSLVKVKSLDEIKRM